MQAYMCTIYFSRWQRICMLIFARACWSYTSQTKVLYGEVVKTVNLKVVDSNPNQVTHVHYFHEITRIVVGATKFMLCATILADGVPFRRRETEPYW
uniref:Uncharacterized protein n=1 Tax=Arion vulgaris TaxID=1028688 RepID=A0A0B6ZPQ5_9EUPU